MRITVRGLTEKETQLRKMADRLRDLSPVLRVIGERFVAETVDSFRQQASPDGTAWPALSGVTVYRRLTKGGKAAFKKRGGRQRRREGALTARAGRMLSPGGIQMLVDNRDLLRGISSKAMPKSLRLSADRVYAATHQFGRADNKMFGHPAPTPPCAIAFTNAGRRACRRWSGCPMARSWCVGRRPRRAARA